MITDEKIIEYVNTLETPEGQDQYTYDTAFIDGAKWMRDKASDLTNHNASVIDKLRKYIEFYKKRETEAVRMGNWSEAFQNEIRVNVLEHLYQISTQLHYQNNVENDE